MTQNRVIPNRKKTLTTQHKIRGAISVAWMWFMYEQTIQTRKPYMANYA